MPPTMEEPKSAKILEVCRVAPQPELAAKQVSLPLTFFDILWLRLPPAQLLFFYEFSHPRQLFFDSVLPKLKKSLSLTLQHFIPLAGNINWLCHSTKPILNYTTGDAVLLTIAESDADFIHLSGTDLCDAIESHPLIPHLAISHEQASAFALQVTLFPGSGFSIGIALHQVVVDGKTTASFMKSWGYISKFGARKSSSLLPPELTPFYDRTVIRDPTGIEEMFVKDWLKQGGPNNRSLMVWDLKIAQDAIRGVFELTRPDIEKLRQLVLTKLKLKVHLSTFTLICAYIWICIVKAEELKTENTVFVVTVDCRTRLDPPIPPTYFGNCVRGRPIVLKTKNLLGEDGFLVAVKALSEALASLEDGVLSGAETWVSNLCKLSTDRRISIAGSPKFEIYSVDFGWGRPKKVEMSSIDQTRAVSLWDSRNGNGGIEVGLVLRKHDMEAFASLFTNGLRSPSKL
ncbi:Phenolic glucoside malonyltransferase [Quillaja saponaria]|uniref:Phenolic glucoside malonyltransferase n=1 Tax=Quillaja saponaria TaxID=32244 RepID=A0AAD7VFU7_QUISA|nr:Phenolic glucoside malonyltransferase [Quillaja saponaria]